MASATESMASLKAELLRLRDVRALSAWERACRDMALRRRDRASFLEACGVPDGYKALEKGLGRFA